MTTFSFTNPDIAQYDDLSHTCKLIRITEDLLYADIAEQLLHYQAKLFSMKSVGELQLKLQATLSKAETAAFRQTSHPPDGDGRLLNATQILPHFKLEEVGGGINYISDF
jgi:hypothetical protein